MPTATRNAGCCVPGATRELVGRGTARSHDVLIVPDVLISGTPMADPYSCQFIVHVETGAGGSRLSLVQARPIIYAGKRFDLLGRTGPGRYMDLGPAAPSPQAVAELRAFLAAALLQPL